MAENSTSGLTIDEVSVGAWKVPTDLPESDGTLEWDSTTIIIVECRAGDTTGIGYSYTHAAAAQLIDDELADAIEGQDPLNVNRCWIEMVKSIRNLGRAGISSSAIAAVDVALWDLKGKLLGLPVYRLIGAVREEVPVYGSGGFTSYDDGELCAQLSSWIEEGIEMVKMKVGREPDRDVDRVAIARDAIGDDPDLFVDANGAYDRKEALTLAEEFAKHGVSWFEEPVSSNDLEGLRLLRDRAPVSMDVTSGEYAYDLARFREMLLAGAVDVMQPDATRCAGITGFMAAAELCRAFEIPVSAHTAPSIHMHLGCSTLNFRHLEYFHDHVRIEKMFFDGFRSQADGVMKPDHDRPGLGIDFQRSDAEPYRTAIG
ncbi:MAG: enolase C-terminal domain-like protein [Thermoanaerobaculia bacterium]|nr:enolase C-terminal domain-like protein [Thermoanaerobaculia bacterium]